MRARDGKRERLVQGEREQLHCDFVVLGSLLLRDKMLPVLINEFTHGSGVRDLSNPHPPKCSSAHDPLMQSHSPTHIMAGNSVECVLTSCQNQL